MCTPRPAAPPMLPDDPTAEVMTLVWFGARSYYLLGRLGAGAGPDDAVFTQLSGDLLPADAHETAASLVFDAFTGEGWMFLDEDTGLAVVAIHERIPRPVFGGDRVEQRVHRPSSG